MSSKSLAERAISIALAPEMVATTLAPGPGPSLSNAKPALSRCMPAWKRAFKAYLATKKRPDHMDRALAAVEAGRAYRNAMPMLAGRQGVRDFIVCAAHGILIGAIPQQESGKLLYAAQIALNILHLEPRQANPPSK